MFIRILGILFFINVLFYSTTAQNTSLGEIHGNFQTDFQYYNPDSLIGAPIVPEKMRLNAFSNVIYTRGNFSAGFRYESYLNQLQGFDPRYQGTGIPFRYASYKVDEMEITVGNYYEQFGSGLIYRTYEERGLGYDNAMDGVRVKYQIGNGLYLKGIIGKQRVFFTQGPGIVRGADGELHVNDMIPGLKEKKTRLILGGSFVSKYQKDEDPVLKLPENVGAFAGRMNIIRGKINFFSEYTYKINDPSKINNYIYKPGEALLVQLNYSQKGLGVSLAAKRIDNLNFRSDRNAVQNNLFINYLPALTRQHTYNLLATLYPYASQPNGEVDFQGELVYTLKKESLLGGKYGTTVLLNYSTANGLDTNTLDKYTGYSSRWDRLGQQYFSDFNVEISRKINKNLKLTGTYAYLVYNMDIVQGLKGKGTIYADVYVLETNYKFNAKNSLKTELQYLYTKQDKGDWATVFAEYTLAPHYFIAVMDQYNVIEVNKDVFNTSKVETERHGITETQTRLHYPIVTFGYMKNTNRISLSYGRQRAGIFCVGGVCRTVPASNGLTVSIFSTF